MAQEKWLVDGEKIIDVDNVTKLKVGLVAGQVNVIGHDESYARVEVHSVKGKDLLVQVVGDTLVVDHAQWSWDNFIEVFKSFRGSARADVTITVPRDIALKFGVVSATALITGLTAEASVSSVSGDVVVDGLYGDLQLNTVSGELSVRNHYGQINAHSISGDITSSGELMRFAGDTVSGDVFLDVRGVPDEVRVNTVSGAITVRLESEVPAQYKINTVSGRLQLDNAEITGVRGAYTGKYGTLDQRWLEFKANTVSGNISVLHQVSA
ncbi:DUF4097 family beta strand repeat-containing protein [Leifsonia sp. H3M29-4]|uniref:DUF4097 family beta strand repeat-containing protein n=1 Tax=Salinibacterium metalliresistens TaxID=3031321 RepID=UPI0023DA03ED|nr:DUF4097 family beta strand repeat-containing protein [Salinibacterium metalliresistens]MDF1477556.1 DUF4097 family beta strand repeat-containing protein [Salinibacterium metalliresistens]